jgi:dihydroorotate dehydrogenase electron transfer subunit
MQRVRVVENKELGGGYLLIRLESPFGPEAVKPGQFVMLRAPGRLDPLLPRAFALFDVRPASNGGPPTLDIFYHVIGKITALMAELTAGEELELLGPLGNAFRLPRGARRAVLVAGGVGLAPMLLLARSIRHANTGRSGEQAVEPLLIYGGRTKEQIVCREAFEAEGCPVLVTTEDGSMGARGLVTDALTELLEARGGRVEDLAVFACGPEGMLKAVGELAVRYGVACQASLEARMACGFGICLGCVVKILGVKRGQPQADGGRYERVCVEGPIFEAREVSWDESAHY